MLVVPFLIPIFAATLLFLRSCCSGNAYARLVANFSRLLLHFLSFFGHIHLHLELAHANRDDLISPPLELPVLAGERLQLTTHRLIGVLQEPDQRGRLTFLLHGEQGQRLAVLSDPSSPRPSNPMDVLVSVLGKVEIDDCLELVGAYIESPSRQTSRNQYEALLRSKVLQYLRPLVLWFLPMKCANMPCLEQIAKLVNCCDLVGENEHLKATCRQRGQVLDQPAHLGLFFGKNEGTLVNLLIRHNILSIIGRFPN